MQLKYSLRSGLRDWDGRTKTQPERVYAAHSEATGFSDLLVELCRVPECADAATWCLKRFCDEGGDIRHMPALVKAAVRAPGWATKLHVLQILVGQNAPAPEAELAELIRQTTTSDRPMLRAWGYAGADILGLRFEHRRAEIVELLRKARETETAGSVRARLKRCQL